MNLNLDAGARRRIVAVDPTNVFLPSKHGRWRAILGDQSFDARRDRPIDAERGTHRVGRMVLAVPFDVGRWDVLLRLES